MNFEFNISEFAVIMSKIEFDKRKFQEKCCGMSPTKIFLDPKTYLIIQYGNRLNTYFQPRFEYDVKNTIKAKELLYGIEIEVVPIEVELIKFGMRDNMETAMAFIYRRK